MFSTDACVAYHKAQETLKIMSSSSAFVPPADQLHAVDTSQQTSEDKERERSAENPNTDLSQEDKQCSNCLVLQEKLELTKQYVNKLKTDLRINNDWKRKYDNCYERIAEAMAKSTVMERTNDELSNTKLADIFDVSVKEQWVNLCEEFSESEESEIHRITNVSELIEDIYTTCLKRIQRDEDTLKQCSFSEDGIVPEEVELAVRMARKRICQTEDHRKKIVEDIGSKIRKSTALRRISGANTEALNKFIDKVVAISWLMVTSDPPLHLNFNVKNANYEGEIRERFVKYSTEQPIIPESGKEGTVLVVAWPCVELKEHKGKDSHSGYLKKGEVVVLPFKDNVQTDTD